MANSKNDSLRQQMLTTMRSMKLGETRQVEIPVMSVDSIRTASYKVGRFEFKKTDEEGVYMLTRRGIENKSLRALVFEALKKGIFPAKFSDAGLNNVRNYVRQYDEKKRTIHKVTPTAGAMVVSRDYAAEHCALLMSALNDKTTSGATIASALGVLISYCKAEQARRFA